MTLFDGTTLPLVAAPMAGGATTPALVTAAARAGALGFLAAGYRTPEDLAAQIAAVRGVPFGVNVFAPNPVPVDPAAFRRYAASLAPDAAALGLGLAGAAPVEDDDHWAAKTDLLLADPVPVVSFTFGLPPATLVAALRRAGTVVAQTVTNRAEARAAAELGVDVLVVQSFAAGAHSGTLTPSVAIPEVPLPDLIAGVRAAVSLPLVAAGGLGTAADVASVLTAGASAAMIGTALLRAPESGASAPHKAALADPSRTETVLTRAFTGRPARGLRNGFIERHDAEAPAGYPAIHHLTAPLRRAAAAAGDADRLHLWAGTGYRHATERPVATILAGLAP
ncbi:nitronate monooxygenase [Dactylosporangium sucinum]|uniref:Propionate 3-nitronate monooxygenase n=1 Tax=Dactylosporangium sucinum TaxID=1424081 RepID=A0A917U8Y4_9ACTN|nr:nitronate monooxygenase [Dactylosporangium sucinum]GGM61283.1 oxidoreductase [Dactylosporangium sucinum]